MKISPHFNLEEFTFSEAAARLGRTIEVPDNIFDNIIYLASEVLEPLRVRLGKPLILLSGYRPEWLNEVVGGSKTSAHMQGLAADVRAVGMKPAVFAAWIRNNASDLKIPIDQVINEFGSWVHIGTSRTKPRKEYLTATKINGKTVYSLGV